MLAKATILLLGVTAAGINAAFIVDSSPHDLNARTANAAGGWALSQTTSFSCPAGNPACGSFWCCPSSLACVTLGSEDIADVCCPTGVLNLFHLSLRSVLCKQSIILHQRPP